MTWLLVAAVYCLMIVTYCMGHSIGYTKGRRDAWEQAITFHPNDVTRTMKRKEGLQ